MKIAILGAGSVGCLIGGAWAAARVDVTLIGRDSICEEIATNGLRVSGVDGWNVHLDPERIACTADPAALGDAEIIALTVKAPGVEAAAKAIAANARSGTSVIGFQNGIGSAERVAALLPAFPIVQGVITPNIVRLAAGHWHQATAGEIIAARTPATEALAAAIGEGPARLVLREDMLPVVWGKLLLNLNNAINALSGLSLLEELKQRDYRRVIAAAMLETLALLDASRIEPAKVSVITPRLLPHVMGAPDPLFGLFLKLQKIAPSARSSMADDLAAGRPTEVDWLNGAVVKLAASLGHEAPVNAVLVALAKETEASGRRWTGAELRARVLGTKSGPFGY